MFPTVERQVVQMVLEGSEGGFEGAMEVLLGMAGPNNESCGSISQSRQSTPAALESSSFAKAASTILDSPQRQSNQCAPSSSAYLTSSPSAQSLTSSYSSSRSLSPPEIDIAEGYRVLIILRGLPGSGKSTMA